MASLNILYSDPHNFLKVTKKIRKVHKQIFCGHQKFLKMFHGSQIIA